MEGGPSHLDTFDPKPLLNELAGQPLPAELRQRRSPRWAKATRRCSRASAPGSSTARAACGSPTGSRTSPQHADDLAVIRSCVADGINHAGGVCQMNTGSILGGRPSLGAWVSYGLGTENQNLPGVRRHARTAKAPSSTARATGAPASCPPSIRAREFSSDGAPIPNLDNPKGMTAERQRDKLDLLAALNRDYAASRTDKTELDARIRSYELAFRMQAEAPEAVDLSKETAATQGALRHGREGDRRLRPQLPARPPARRTRRALRAALQRRRQQVGRHTKHREEPRHALPRRGQARSPACSRT